MTDLLSEKKVKFHLTIIGSFYTASAVWEFLLGITMYESKSPGSYFLLDIYRNYMIVLSIITFLIGRGLLYKINLARIVAVIIAWWNLFTSPLIGIWWSIYSIETQKFFITDLKISFWITYLIIFSLSTFFRIYIIRTLNIKRAGYLFLKKK